MPPAPRRRCARPGCTGYIDHANAKVKYHPACAKLVHVERLRALDAKRGQANRERAARPVPCAVCGTPFVKKYKTAQKYCGDACAGVGLQRAIERQRERRQGESTSGGE